MPAGLGEADMNLNTDGMTEDNYLTVEFFGHLRGHFDKSLLVQLGLKVSHKVMEEVHAERLGARVVEEIAELERHLMP